MDKIVAVNHPMVSMSAGERFHSFEMAREIARHSYLAQLITVYPARKVLEYIGDVYRKPSIRSFLLKKLVNMPDVIANNAFDIFSSFVMDDTDILHAWSSFASISMRGRKTIIEHGSTHPAYQSEVLGVRNRLLHKFEEEFDMAERIIVPTEFVRSTMTTHQHKVIVLPYGVTQRPYHQRSMGKRLRLLFAGRVCVRKGVDLLLAGIRGFPVDLTIVGDNVERIPIPSAVRYYPHSDLSAFIPHCDVFILPSREEGMPLAALEALSYGRPLIVTKECGIPSGRVIDASVDGVRRGIEYYLDADMNDESQRAWRDSHEYRWDVRGKRMIEVYNNVYYQINNIHDGIRRPDNTRP